MRSVRAATIWAALATVVSVPMILAAMSPLIAWRDGVYVASGFMGMLALALLLVQPLLAGGYLPGLQARRGREIHRWLGIILVASIILHVAGLWLTSAPDVIDALLFASPTSFSPWGVIAMWATFATATLAALRSRLRIPPKIWRIAHTALAVVVVIGSVVHALLVEGMMEPFSKAAICSIVLLAAGKMVHDLRVVARVWWARRLANRI